MSNWNKWAIIQMCFHTFHTWNDIYMRNVLIKKSRQRLHQSFSLVVRILSQPKQRANNIFIAIRDVLKLMSYFSKVRKNNKIFSSFVLTFEKIAEV